MKQLVSFAAVLFASAALTLAQNFSTPGRLPVWTFDADLGVQVIQDIGVKQGLGIPLSGAEGSLDPGPRLGLVLGYHVNEDWRLELETGVGWNKGDDFTVGGVSYAWAGDADVWSVPVLFNVVWSPNRADNLVLRPFIGAGAGGQWIYGSLDIPGLSFSDSGDSFVFAYQVKAGLAYRVCKSAEITLTYRFLSALNHQIKLTEFEDAFIHSLSLGVQVALP